MRGRSPAYPLALLALLAILFVWAGIGPTDRADWMMESILVVLFVPLMVATFGRFRLSDASYTLLFLFLALHVVGSHWTYSNVPLPWEDWGFERNHYDRVVHFGFGFLLAAPIREALLRFIPLRGFWSYYLPLDVTLAFSAIYEIIEWLAAAVVAPDLGAAYLGTQGDEFDAVKDMALAGLGALLAMLACAAWVRSRAARGLPDPMQVVGSHRTTEVTETAEA